MGSLYELTDEMTTLLDWLEDPEADQEAIKDTLEGVQCEFEAKAEGYCKVIRQIEADAKALKEEEERFNRRRVACENAAKRLKDALQNAMILTGNDGKDGLAAGLFKLKVVGNGGLKPLKITGDVPSEFKRVIYEDDQKAIREMLEHLPEGQECEWAHLEERGRHLSIK